MNKKKHWVVSPLLRHSGQPEGPRCTGRGKRSVSTVSLYREDTRKETRFLKTSNIFLSYAYPVSRKRELTENAGPKACGSPP